MYTDVYVDIDGDTDIETEIETWICIYLYTLWHAPEGHAIAWNPASNTHPLPYPRHSYLCQGSALHP